MNNEEKILEMLGQITGQIGQINGQIEQINGQIEQINGRLDRIETRMDHLEERMDHLETRMDHLETRMDCLEAEQAEMKKTLVHVNATQESLVLPRLQELYEGHHIIMETLDSRYPTYAEFEELKDDHFAVKESVRKMIVDINELKKAQ
ncbi:MAG: hypothetical protein K2O18_14490 [Oscillospiraceae bacterium]|nr:hypothetical protein [Oscillospiraceae bacterium]